MFSLLLFVVVAVQFFITGQHLSLGWFVPALIADGLIVYGHDYYTAKKRESK